MNDPLFSEYVVDDLGFDDPLLQGAGEPEGFKAPPPPRSAKGYTQKQKVVRKKKAVFNDARAQTGYSICGLGVVGMFAPLVGLELKFIGALGDGYWFFTGMIILLGCGFIVMASLGDLKKGFSLAAIPALVALGGMIYSVALGSGMFRQGRSSQANSSRPIRDDRPIDAPLRLTPPSRPSAQAKPEPESSVPTFVQPPSGSLGDNGAFGSDDNWDDDSWDDDDEIPSRSDPFGSRSEPPGTPATLEGLKPGRAIHVFWGASWYLGKVVRIEGESVRVHYDGWSDNFDETVKLSRIRLVEEKNSSGDQ